MFKKFFSSSNDSDKRDPASVGSRERKETLEIPFRSMQFKGTEGNRLTVARPFDGIAMAYSAGREDPFLKAVLRAELNKGWGVLLWEHFIDGHTKFMQDLVKELKAERTLPEAARFRMLNFNENICSDRVNPIQCRYIRTLGDAIQAATSFLGIVYHTYHIEGNFNRFRAECENLLAAAIYFLVNYDKRPYDCNGNPLRRVVSPASAEGAAGPVRYVDAQGVEVPVHHWVGRYSSFPHVVSLIMLPWCDMFDILSSNPDTERMVKNLRTQLANKDTFCISAVVGTLQDILARFMTPKMCWVLSGDDFDLNLADKDRPTLLAMQHYADGTDNNEDAMNSFLLDRILVETMRRSSFDRPLGVVLADYPDRLAKRLKLWQDQARSYRVSLTVGMKSVFELAESVGRPTAHFLYSQFGTVVAGSRTDKDTALWLDRQVFAAQQDRLTERDLLPGSVAGVCADGPERNSFVGVLSEPSAGDSVLGDSFRDSLLRGKSEFVDRLYGKCVHEIQTDIEELSSRIFNRLDSDDEISGAPSDPMGGWGMDASLRESLQNLGPYREGMENGLFEDIVVEDEKVPEAESPRPSIMDALEVTRPSADLPDIDLSDFSQLYQRAADDDSMRTKMEL